MPHHILVVDDDSHIREVLRYTLEKEGLRVSEAPNGLLALQKIKEASPDAIILDVMMPEMNGLELCRELRKTAQTPILFLSSKDTELDLILGLELGGDDYMVKPFSPKELTARLNVILRRLTSTQNNHAELNLLCVGQVLLNPNTYQVYWQDQPLQLTVTEFNLLTTFLQAPNRTYTRDQLVLQDIFKDVVSDRTIDSHIRRLRQKFALAGCPQLIETVHGFGYKLGPCLP